MGAKRSQHDRSLHDQPTRDEFVGRTPGADPSSAMGRSATEFAVFAIAPGLQTHQTNGPRAPRARSRSRGTQVVKNYSVFARLRRIAGRNLISPRMTWRMTTRFLTMR